jgi:hypothetical protein
MATPEQAAAPVKSETLEEEGVGESLRSHTPSPSGLPAP